MTNPYIAQDVLDQCREARRQGRTLEQLGGQLNCDPAHLARLLGVPDVKPAASNNAADGFDLWSCDRLDGQL